MSAPNPIDIVRTLPDMQKVFLEHALAMMDASGKVRLHPPAYRDEPEIHQRDGHLVGQIIAKHLPPEITDALRDFYTKEGPPVLVLRGFPKLKPIELSNPNSGSECLMEGLGNIMAMGYTSEGMKVDKRPRSVPTNLLHRNVPGSETQLFHQDTTVAEYIAFSVISRGGDQVTTNFTRNAGRDGFTTGLSGDKADVHKIVLEDGDIVFFRNQEVYHGRENQGPSQLGDRMLHHTEYNYFDPGKPNLKWSTRMDRAEELLKPANLSK